LGRGQGEGKGGGRGGDAGKVWEKSHHPQREQQRPSGQVCITCAPHRQLLPLAEPASAKHCVGAAL